MKDFLLLSNINAITYKDFFPLLKDNNVRLGYTPTSGGMDMYAGPNFDPGKKKVKYDENGNMIVNIEGVCWYTTLPTPNKRKLILTKKYKHDEYPHYDNYNAINVNKVKDIPYDYDCVMGVPITIFGYDLDNVEVIKVTNNSSGNQSCYIDGKKIYERVLIKKKIEVIGEKTINGKYTKINGKERYRMVLIRLIIRRKQL